jgi:hypothetical protein
MVNLGEDLYHAYEMIENIGYTPLISVQVCRYREK